MRNRLKNFKIQHNPPHFHAEYQGYKAIITIQNGIVDGKMPKRALKLIFEWLELHEEELLEVWTTIEKTGEFNRIEPLA